MEPKGRIANSLVFFHVLLRVYFIVHSVKAVNTSNITGEIDLCADIIGPKWNLNKQGKSPCPTLLVWVPKKIGFTEFVKVNENNEVEDGFSIAVLCYAIQSLPFNVQPIFRPFINERGEMNGTYDELLKHIQGQKCQAVAGDVTIRGSRTQYVSFTIPYLSVEIYWLVHAEHEWNQTLLTFLKPFSRRLWITLVCACILTGVALAFLECRADNPKFARPFYNQLIMVFWFPVSTFFFHEGKIQNKCSKVVLVMWLSMIFIVLQIFTATLSSWLTLDQLRPQLPSNYENIGYPNGSFIRDLLIQKYKSSGKNLVPLSSYEDYHEALSNGRVNAIADHLPYINLFLAKYGSVYTKHGPIHQEAGMAFALPIGSDLMETLSRAVINVTESEIMTKMKTMYLGISTTDKLPNQVHPQSLDVQSFTGLFIFMGIVTIVAIILSEVSLMHRDSKIGIEEDIELGTIPKQVQVKIIDKSTCLYT